MSRWLTHVAVVYGCSESGRPVMTASARGRTRLRLRPWVRRTTRWVGEHLLRPRRARWRVLAVVVGIAWVFSAWYVMGFFELVAPLGAWKTASVVFLPGTLFASAVFGLRRQWFVPLAATVMALLFGIGAYWTSVPDGDRLRHVAEQVGTDVPGWDLISSEEDGNGWCWSACTNVTYTYRTHQSPEQVSATIDELLTNAGWHGGPRPQDDDLLQKFGPQRVREDWSRLMYDVVVQMPALPPAEYHKAPDGQPLDPDESLVYVIYS